MITRRIAIALRCLLLAACLWLNAESAWLAIVSLIAWPLPADLCIIFSDAFVSDFLAADYTVRRGSFTVSGGTCSTTSSNALIVCNTPLTSGVAPTAARAQIEITCASTSDIGILVFNYLDDNNYFYATIQPGAANGTLKLFRINGGVTAQEGATITLPGFTAGTTQGLEICMHIASPFRTWAKVDTNRVVTVNSAGYYSNKCGFGTGVGSSNVTFERFSITQHAIDNGSCQTCGQDCFGYLSLGDSIQLTFAGLTCPSGCLNGHLADVNSTFLFTFTEGEGTFFSNEPCGLNTVLVTVADCACFDLGAEISISTQEIAGSYWLVVNIDYCEGLVRTTLATFKKEIAAINLGEPNLATILAGLGSNFSVPRTFGRAGGGGAGTCNGSAMTCTATYIPV